MARAVAWLIFAIFSLFSGSLLAQEPVPIVPGEDSVPAPPQPRAEIASSPHWRWYGWQTLIADGAAVLVLMAAVESHESQLLAPLSVAGYALGGPGIHLSQRKPWKAAGSVALRIGLPALGLGIGLGATHCPTPTGDQGNCGTLEAVVGLGAGVLLASAIDASALAWMRTSDTASATQLGIVPVLSPDGKRGELRVVGTF